MVLHTDAYGVRTRNVYDGLNRLVKTIRDLDGDGPDEDGPDIVTEQTWDDSSRLIARTDDNGHVTRYAYDALNRLIAVRMGDGTIHQVGAGITWPASEATPVVTGFASGYDGHDNRVIVVDARGSRIDSTFDKLNRVVGRTITPGPGVSTDTTTETYQYDGLSRLVLAQDDDSIVKRRYDSLDNILFESIQVGSDPAQVTVAEYDGVSNQTKCFYPGGRVIETSTFDSLNRPVWIRDVGLAENFANYNYIGPYRVERRGALLANNIQADYFYDNLRRMTQVRHSENANPQEFFFRDNHTFAWGKMYNKLSRTNTLSGVTQTFTYDDAYRLTNVVVDDGAVPQPTILRDATYNHDGAQNRTSVLGAPDAGPHVGTYTQDVTLPIPGDWQVNQYTQTPTEDRIHDLNGNLTMTQVPAGLPGGGSPLGTMMYDYRNQMVQYDDLSGPLPVTTIYRYDALGRRIAKIVDVLGVSGGPFETRYLYGGEGFEQVVEEQDSAGVTLATYVYGWYIDEVLSMERDTNGDGVTEHYFFHADDLYNVTSVTDINGDVVERYEYGDYGVPTIFAGPAHPGVVAGTINEGDVVAASAIGNPYLFNGRRYDPESKFYWYRTRYLDPVHGRFTTRDTIGTWGDPSNLGNGYAYVGNNPWTFLDPSGRGILVAIGATDTTAGAIVRGAGQGILDTVVGIVSGVVQVISDPITPVLDIVDAAGESYDRNRDAGSGVAGAVGHTIGEGVAKAVGLDGIMDAIEGEDDQGRRLNPQERARRATGGAIGIGATVAGGAGVVGKIGRIGRAAGKVRATPCAGKGSICRVPGSGTPSGKPYIGRHNKPNPRRTRRSNDGRDRTQAEVIDNYDPNDVQSGRMKEQKAIDEAGGVGELDNRRNEIAPNTE